MSGYSKDIFIVDEMAAVVAKVNTALAPMVIYYMYGHPKEIVGRLQEKAKSTTKKDTAFPLICLLTDIPEEHGPAGFYSEVKLNIIICTSTQQNFRSEERTTSNFKPILYPIKDELLKQVARYPQFGPARELNYRSIDRYFWGKNGLYGSEGNIFNDYIDAIEIQNLQITILNKIC